ncbi:MAG: hypothetical protein O3A00_03735 [Planctomycetota bacterium]|nr:hypothetical protein [Planctomycetota bacterium]
MACALGLALVSIGVRGFLQGDVEPEALPGRSAPVVVQARYGFQWDHDGERILVLRGDCVITQGATQLRAQQAVIWNRRIDNSAGGSLPFGLSPNATTQQLAIYLDRDAEFIQPHGSRAASSLFSELVTSGEVTLRIQDLLEQNAENDGVFRRARQRRRSVAHDRLRESSISHSAPTSGLQLASLSNDVGEPATQTVRIQSPTGDFRRVRIFPRSTVPYNVKVFPSTNATPPEQIWVITGGVNVLVDGLLGAGTVDMSADNVVIWTAPVDDFRSESLQPRDALFQLYLDGNIIVRQGTTVLRAARAFYDAREEQALLLKAELKTYVPELQGHLRVRADRLKQLSRDTFHARNAWTTTSRMGKPGYRLQASEAFIEHRLPVPGWGKPKLQLNTETGQYEPRAVPWITSLNNTFYIDDFPLLYGSRLSMPAEDPNVPLRSVRYERDNVFGSQVRTRWNLAKLMDLDLPDGISWDLDADYMSKRGPALGTSTKYEGSHLFGIPGRFKGRANGYSVQDDGTDNLGLDRRRVEPAENFRGITDFEHRQELPYNSLLRAEFGLISDLNYLEQFDEQRFDEGKDVETILNLKQDMGNLSWSVLGRPQVNQFETTTEWLPRGDVYALGEPLFGGLLTWTSHSTAGYGRLHQGDLLTASGQTVAPLPYVADVEGAVLSTRHELAAPFHFGPVSVVPFVMGSADYWSEDMTGNSIDRFVGRVGVRSSVMFWKPYPFLQSRVFNLNGLAHKIVLSSEYAYTDSTRDLSLIPQYNEIEDNAQERFRQRAAVNTFGGATPAEFGPRFYGQRAGLNRLVSVPYNELIDDQQVLRLNMRHRLQTKVGPPHRLRIKDWMTLDTGAAFFPNADDDNFGEDVGLLYGQYRWNVGDRTSLLGSANYDLFDNAQQLWSAGILSQRSTRGSVYLGIRQVKGAGLNSQIATASFSYAMGPKWVATAGTAYDLGEQMNRGQTFTITRVGADFLVHIGGTYDQSKNNAGIAISLEPRFGPFDFSSTQLSSLLGINRY